MEVTLGQVYASFSILSKLVDQKLPIRLAFRFTKLIKSLNEEYQALEKLRDGLVKKFGEKIEGQDGAFRVPDTRRKEFIAEFQELLNESVTIPWEPISIDAVGESAALSVRELNQVGWLFSEFVELAAEASRETAAAAAEEDFEDEDTEEQPAEEVSEVTVPN